MNSINKIIIDLKNQIKDQEEIISKTEGQLEFLEQSINEAQDQIDDLESLMEDIIYTTKKYIK